MDSYSHENNVYAYDIKQCVKHISEVASGRKGYYCMGCGRQMQAKKGFQRRNHFAHDATDVENRGKCTFSDETHRHKLAKEALQRLKQIRVPSLYKYSPFDMEDEPRLIRNAHNIEAARVEAELPFFENEAGEVKWGRNLDMSESTGRHLLIQPDIAFFNKEGKPILLIEIVATHKVNKEKLIKIWRLGIDTIQVTVPKDSPEEIESSFYQSTRTKWLYNNEQERTDYLQLSSGNGEGVPPLDAFQRQLLKSEESVACREAQINNLLRAIGKCVGSEQYRAAQTAIINEISRVEGNATRVGAEVRAVQNRHTETATEQLRPEEKLLDRETEIFAQSDQSLRRKTLNLEERYIRKRGEIATAQSNYQPSSQTEIDRIARDLVQLGTGGGTLEERESEFAAETARLERAYKNEQTEIEDSIRREKETINSFTARRTELPEYYRKVEVGIRQEFELEEGQLRDNTAASEAEMRADFERLGRESVEAVEREDDKGPSSINRRIGKTLEAGRLLDTMEAEGNIIRRLRKAKAAFDSRAYKNWI
ncbi:competence protein CoiA family protein [Hymenobacter actinosclerus]|uniref:Competence protein CoiA-like family protein n=1 Tax=Hymenobacter actinosclerus TaxID=82805 RepID=A0A1I0IQS0_9BACT|nr:competence protein CoiA family protein [Hymenobacter actinosclerus]SET99281.1 Competence protein CoiA-like family protein [Hymenobacter actinosclerus]